MLPKLRERRRSRSHEQIMARSLENSVRQENLHSALAGLRVKREGDVSRLEDEAMRAELLDRVEKIRVRAVELASRRTVEPARRCPPHAAPEAAGIAFSYSASPLE